MTSRAQQERDRRAAWEARIEAELTTLNIRLPDVQIARDHAVRANAHADRLVVEKEAFITLVQLQRQRIRELLAENARLTHALAQLEPKGNG